MRTVTELALIPCAMLVAIVSLAKPHNAQMAGDHSAVPQDITSIAQQTTMEMSSDEFTQWVKKRRESAYRDRQPPTLIIQAVSERLQRHRWISDETILSAVNAVVSYESSSTTQESRTTVPDFRNALEFVGKVIAGTSDRQALQGLLHRRSAELLRIAGDRTGAMKEYEEAVPLLTKSAVELEQARIDAIVQMADMSYLNGDKGKAEGLYLKALSYDWYKVDDAKRQQELALLYVAAGRGLIECRRHNLKALKNTYFIPATLQELGPLLEKAVSEALGSQLRAESKPASRPAAGGM